MDDIAVIGVGLRFPGDASSPESLWSVLEQGESQWSEIPMNRLNIDGYYHPSGERQGSISFRGAHFIREDVARFDAPFFSVAAADAKAIDPQQRLLLEVCYEALENAGCTKEAIDGTDVSVYVGSFVKDYEQICLRDPDWQPQYAATGNGIAIMSNRISYYFNLHGPSMTIDTGCSGSLVSVHLAAQSLRSGESSMAIAAGAGLILTPNTIMPMTALNFLSPDGKCYTFDSRANGYGRGEGIGVVILKRLSDAIRDNDTIRAVIRGTNVNQDGRTTGITLPSKEAQVANIKAVYMGAGLSFSDTAYVECHGTGTQAGDWRELKAISETLGACRTSDNPIFVGSVKPNIGHLEGAAGVAGLIKAVLMLERERIPPHVNFETPNPDIDFKEWKVQVSRVAQAWPSNLKKRVSVNCFGFGGTNAHVILDGAAEYLSTKQWVAHHSSATCKVNGLSRQNGSHHSTQKEQDNRWQVFCFSSNESSGIKRIVTRHESMIRGSQNLAADFLPNYAYTMGCRRSCLEWRTFFVSSSISDLADQMSHSKYSVIRSSPHASSRLCFLFCGQGSQWARMGLDLKPFPVFWNSINSASWYLSTILESPFDLMKELSIEAAESALSSTHISQPATTAIQIAIVDLLHSLGVEPDFVVGHSSGEIAAALLSWARCIYIANQATRLSGGMIVVSMSLNEATSYICTFFDLEIACVNSPGSTTLSGERKIIEHASQDLAAKNIRHRVLSVDMAYHSTYMKSIEAEYVYNISSISPSVSRKAVRMFSSVSGSELRCSSLDAGYWGKNMVSTVQFSSAIQSLMAIPEDQQPSIFIEMGPSTVLRTLVLDTLATRVKPEQFCSALDKRRPGMASILDIAGKLWSSGKKIKLQSAISRRSAQQRPKCLANLPSYPWNHTKSYWHESHLSLANRFREYGRLDLIGAPTPDSVSFEPRWRGFLRISENPWIQDHQVQKTVIYPAAGMISMVLEGARQLKKNIGDLIGYEIRDMRFEKAIVVPTTTHGVEIALNMRAEPDAGNQRCPHAHYTFSIYSKALEKGWEKHATGHLYFCSQSQNLDARFAAFRDQQDEISESCTTSVIPRQLYEHLDSSGISYGPMFRNIMEIKKGTDRCIGKIRVPDTRSKMPANFEHPHLLHPATLDSMFQTLFTLDSRPKIPYLVQSIFVSDSVDLSTSREFVGHATAKRQRNEAEAQIWMCCTDRPLDQIIIKGLCFSGDLFISSAGPSFLPNYRNLATEVVWREDSETANFKSFRHAISLLCHKYPKLSILQIGGGFLLAKCALLAAAENADQPVRLGRYSFIDQKQPNLDFIDVKKTPFSSYIEQLPDLASVQTKYDLVLVNGQTDEELAQAQYFLKPSGMILQSNTAGLRLDKPRASNPCSEFEMGWSLSEVQVEWCRRTGMPYTGEADDTMPPSMCKVSARSSGFYMPPIIVLLLPDSIVEEVSLFEIHFRKLLAVNSPTTSLAALQLQDAVRDISAHNGALFISLIDFSPDTSLTGFIFKWSEADFRAFHLLQSKVNTIVWITRGANMIPTAPHVSPIIGLARTLMSEDLRKTFATFDLSQESSLSEPRILDLFVTVCRGLIDPALRGDAREVDFAEKNGALFIPRLETMTILNDIIERGDSSSNIVEKRFRTEESETGSQVLLESLLHTDISPSSPLQHSQFQEINLGELGPRDVAISFESAILSSGSKGMLSQGEGVGRWQSHEVVGHVSATGSDVNHYQRGDKVTAILPKGNGLRSTACVDSALVMHHKPGFTPSRFLCAYYALFDVGKLCRGKDVLIHAGASGFGLAAVELALLSGVKVLVTVLGPHTDRQRNILNRRGIEQDHILDGNSDSYPSTVKLLTQDRGVDLVYNPTHKDVQLSIACVRRYGTVIHLVDSSKVSSFVSAPGIPVTMVGFDLATLLIDDLDHVIEMVDSMNELTANTSFEWMSDSTLQQRFDISQLQDAMKANDGCPYFGSVSITSEMAQGIRIPVQVLQKKISTPLKASISEDATYALVGGLGGLGKSIAKLLVANGAKYLAFLSRSGAASSRSARFLQNLSEQGVTCKAFSIDICDQAALQDLLRAAVTATMPPIVGVFHCAAVIKDAVFENMTYDNWSSAFNPKALGARNLVEAVEAIGHDPFYVFLSSSAGVIGTRGQANYAAGNAFLDALAGNLRIRGRRAISLGLGPILGAGMLAEDEVLLDILRASGFYGIRHDDFLTIIKHAITGETVTGRKLPPQVVLGVGTGGLILQNQPADPYWSRTALYSYLGIIDMPEPDLSVPALSALLGIKAELASCNDAEIAASIVCAGLSGMLAKSMNMTAEEIDPSRPPSVYGVDSLVAVGVRNWVSGNCGVDVSVFEILSELTVFELSRLVAQKGKFGLRANKSC
ncbi:Beta-ketoacyl synthase [Cordyceps militaris]|uniref:Beta-ketoacyl synthase n=1 Tax=Cordyceps militaris TaxID=73501 RepID=A0A2H4SB47_CORMI|nr:Beta-ketoacyl synthase [Cordyceps militaris]